MERNRQYGGPQMDLSEFLPKAGIYWVLGKMFGLEGNASTACAILGPIGEKILNVPLLESLGQAIERQAQQKSLDEIRFKFKQDLESLFAINTRNPATEPDNSLSRLEIPAESSSLILPAIDAMQTVKKRDGWLDVITHPAIIDIFGGRGSGKSATGYYILEHFKYRLTPYVVGFPEHNKGLLPDWIGIVQRLEDVPPGSIALLDEAYLWLYAREWQKTERKDICRLLNLSRQQGKTIIFIAQLGRQLDINVVSSADILIWKNPSMLQVKFDRPEFRNLLKEAEHAFKTVKGDIRRWSYVTSQRTDFSGLLENELPTFWSPKLSNVYANVDNILPPKLPVKMAPEEKQQKARELHQAGWSQGKLANYFGVSKITKFNWLHGYPYRKEIRL